MKNCKEDDDLKLVPMNMKFSPEYAFMPMKKKNPYKKMNYNMNSNMMNKYNYYHNHNCCCMHNHNLMHPQCSPSNHYDTGILFPGNMDDMMVKTLITVKKKSELFD